MQRGDVRSYVRPATPDRQRHVVIVSSDGLNDSPRPWLLGIELRGRDPGDLLAIPVGSHGWAYAGDLQRLYRTWTGPLLDRVDTTTLTRIDNALRAALDL